MNQRLDTEPATRPNASSAHMALVLGIADRGHRVFNGVAESATMSPDDQADVLGRLIDELDTERAQIVSARESAYRLAELEILLGNEATNGGM